VCLSQAMASHSHKMWTEISSSVPHLLQMGLLSSPIMPECLLKVLCPVSRPITTLVSVLLKDNSRAPVARSGPEINSGSCLCVLQGSRHNVRRCFPTQRFIFLRISCLETPKKGWGPTNRWAETVSLNTGIQRQNYEEYKRRKFLCVVSHVACQQGN